MNLPCYNHQWEQAFNAAMDQVDQLDQALALYPIQIKEAQSSLASARARLSVAVVNLDRCTVAADFDARVKSVSIERGQYVAPGQQALTLADDSTLEIHVPLDSRDARSVEDFYHVIGNQDGVFGCMTLLGCQDNCPKDLPHMQQIAYLRRKMATALV